MEALRIVNLLIWTAMVVQMVRGAWGAASGKGTRRGDPMRLACLSMAVVIVGFNARWLFAPDNEELFRLLYVLCAGVGIYIMILARAYGRGPRV